MEDGWREGQKIVVIERRLRRRAEHRGQWKMAGEKGRRSWLLKWKMAGEGQSIVVSGRWLERRAEDRGY